MNISDKKMMMKCSLIHLNNWTNSYIRSM